MGAPSPLKTIPSVRHEPVVERARQPFEAAATLAAVDERRLDEAYERGRRDALAWARTEHERALELERAALHERLQADQREFRRNEFAGLAENLCANVEEIERSLADALIRILSSFFEDRIAGQAFEEVCEKAAKLAGGSSALRLKIRGPETYFDLFRARLAPLGAEIEFTAEANSELTVEARETVLELQLQTWAAALAAIDA